MFPVTISFKIWVLFLFISSHTAATGNTYQSLDKVAVRHYALVLCLTRVFVHHDRLFKAEELLTNAV